MMAKPGRPRKSAPKPPKQRAPKPRLPAGLTPGQRKHLRDLLAAVDPGALFEEYVSTLKMRDRAQAELDAGALVVSTERHGRKLHPVWQAYNACCDRLLRLRDAMVREAARPASSNPAPPAASGNEARVQEFLESDDLMPFLIDDMGNNVAGDSSWRQDERVLAKLRRLGYEPQ